MAGLVDIGVSSLCLLVLLRIALTDFRSLRIPNRDVLVLTALAAILLIPGVTADGLQSLIVALLLFGLGVVFWLFRAMGAGDAKLFFPLGILLGAQGVAIFAILLLPSSLIFLGLTRLGLRGALGQGAVANRLAGIGRGNGIPYGVPMAISTCVAVIWRLLT